MARSALCRMNRLCCPWKRLWEDPFGGCGDEGPESFDIALVYIGDPRMGGEGGTGAERLDRTSLR